MDLCTQWDFHSLRGRKHQDQWEPRIGIWLFRYETRFGASSSRLLAAFSHSSSYHGPPWSSTETSSGASSCLTLAGSTPCTVEIWSPVLHIFCGGANNRIWHVGNKSMHRPNHLNILYLVWEKFRWPTEKVTQQGVEYKPKVAHKS